MTAVELARVAAEERCVYAALAELVNGLQRTGVSRLALLRAAGQLVGAMTANCAAAGQETVLLGQVEDVMRNAMLVALPTMGNA